MSDTPILGITELAESQAGKAISVNEALHRLEGVLVRVLSATTTAEPGSPSEGDTYIVPDSATGTNWSGQDGKIAHYYGGAWHFYTPPEGLAIYSTGDSKTYRYLSSTWGEDAGGGASAFTDLSDVPVSYSGQGGKRVAVNLGATALEFVEAAGGGARNYLLNPDFAVNQRGFAGGSLSEGDYGFDRWRAGEILEGFPGAIMATFPSHYYRLNGATPVDLVGALTPSVTDMNTGFTSLLPDDPDGGAFDNGHTVSGYLEWSDAGALVPPAEGSFAMVYKPFAWPTTAGSAVWIQARLNSGDYKNSFQIENGGNCYAGWRKTADYRVLVASGTLTPPANGVGLLIVTWKDDPDETNFYLNGTLLGSTSSLVQTDLTGKILRVGRDIAGIWNGVATYQDICFWDHLLTPQQCDDLYTASGLGA